MEIDYLMGTCSSPFIAKLSQQKGKKFSYKKACKLIKEYDHSLWHSLGLEFYNPWKNDTFTLIYNGMNILHINHSQIDYLFVLKS